MKVTLKTRGGRLAAIPQLRGLVRELDTSGLAPAARAELERLIKAATAAAPKREPSPGSAVEAESHTITIEGAPSGEAPVTLRQTETTITEEFRALAEWIKRHAKPQ